ncbi:IS200/IS605 family transposase [Salinimicrobium sp. CDJ15-81-2]|nr:IS200/IS605 family transposase [Salinimicrobium nanhaiense]
MANTYTQIHIQVIFAVQNRQSLIRNNWEAELFKYITGIIQNNGHKVLQINGMPDHVHILIGMRPTQALSELMKQVKHDSSKWINNKGFLPARFSWQAGYGAFSYSKSEVPGVIKYVQNQKEHHKSLTFREEYLKLLETHHVEFEERFLFKTIE